MWTAAHQNSLSFIISQFAQTHVHWVNDAIQPSHPLSPLSPPAFNFSQQQGLFQWINSLHQVAKVLELQVQHQSFQLILRVDFFKTDWFDPLADQEILKSLLQHHSLKSSILQLLSLPYGQLSYPYMTSEKTIDLTIWTFVGKVISLLFNMLSRFVIAFLPRSKHLLISWLQSLSTLVLEPKKIKSVTVSMVSPSICHEVMGPDATIFIFWMLSFKPTFSLYSFIFIKRLFSFSSLSAIGWCHLHIWGCWHFLWHFWFQLVLHPAQHITWCPLHIS